MPDQRKQQLIQIIREQCGCFDADAKHAAFEAIRKPDDKAIGAAATITVVVNDALVRVADEIVQAVERLWPASIPWNPGPPPPEISARLLLLDLHSPAAGRGGADGRFEYHGQPVLACWYGHKGKTTLDPARINPEDVARWAWWEEI